jgi:hypothetical protein
MGSTFVDFIANWIGLTIQNVPSQVPGSWMQMGFWEGWWGGTISYPGPIHYYETTDCLLTIGNCSTKCLGYQKIARNDFGGLTTFPIIQTLNQWFSCNGSTYEKFQLIREHGVIGTFYLPSSSGRPGAYTEHYDHLTVPRFPGQFASWTIMPHSQRL